MRRQTNLIIYGILSISSGILIACLSVLLYPMLTINELLHDHPFMSWAIPLVLITFGWVLIQLRKGNNEDE